MNTNSKKIAVRKKKVIVCSTPDHRLNSPSRNSRICDTEDTSPVPLSCTQDGTEGQTDVIWGYYTPKSEHTANKRRIQSTPLSTKNKKFSISKHNKYPSKRKLRDRQKTHELFQDLKELNDNVYHFVKSSTQTGESQEEKQNEQEVDDIFNDSPPVSPKSCVKLNSGCLRKNLLTSKFCKPPEPDTALESDDSMNECLLKASQVVEEKYLKINSTSAKNICHSSESCKFEDKHNGVNINQESVDVLFRDILDSSIIENDDIKVCNLSNGCDDTFDNLVGNLNDSALEMLTQIPLGNDTSGKKNGSCKQQKSDWTIKEVVLHDSSPISKSFVRHSSMPESPSMHTISKPSTSEIVFGRYSSMPFEKKSTTSSGDSPIKCTPEEIRKKRQQARDKLQAKRLLPFTSQHTVQSEPSVQSSNYQCTQSISTKRTFQPRQPMMSAMSNVTDTSKRFSKAKSNCEIQRDIFRNEEESKTDIKSIIERKRQEALLKLRKRQVSK